MTVPTAYRFALAASAAWACALPFCGIWAWGVQAALTVALFAAGICVMTVDKPETK